MRDTDVSVLRMFGRAIVLSCPWCGGRRTFIRRWLGKYPRCRTCGIQWRREEGFELGAVAVNTVVTFAALTVAMTIAFIRTSPDIPVLPLVVAFVGVAVLLPIVLYPFSYTIWLAFDLAANRPSQKELTQAAQWVVESGSAT